MVQPIEKPRQPLNEVFGFPPYNFSDKARRYRQYKYCPFNNSSGPKCTKSSKTDPIGVCSIKQTETNAAIVCPVRFREDWLIADHTAEFFFPAGTSWTSFTEVTLLDADGKTAGKLDMVLVSYDEDGFVTDFGVVEVQSVYVSGSTRKPFKYYMEDPDSRHDMDWTRQPSGNYPRPDPRSSMNKRLVPQLIAEGAILGAWGKKLAVVTHSDLFSTLPSMPNVREEQSDLAWFLYDLKYSEEELLHHLSLEHVVYTMLRPAMEAIIRPKPGSIDQFVAVLQAKLDEHLETNDSENMADNTTFKHLFGGKEVD